MWLSSHYTLMDVRGGNELFGAGTTTCAATFNGILFTSFISLQMWLSSLNALMDVRGGNELFGAGTMTCAATYLFNGVYTSFISLQMWLSSLNALMDVQGEKEMVGSVKKYLKLFNLHNNFIVYFAFAFLFLPTSYAAQDDRNKESTTPFGVFCNGRSVHKDLLNRGHICFLRAGRVRIRIFRTQFSDILL